MLRRGFLRQTGTSLEGVALSGLLARGACAAGRIGEKACFQPLDAGQAAFLKIKPDPYKVAVSKSLISNDWRVGMVKLAEAYAQRPDVKPMISDLTSTSSGPEVSAQFEQLILQGIDIIVTDAASPTGLNAVIEEAAGSGR